MPRFPDAGVVVLKTLNYDKTAGFLHRIHVNAVTGVRMDEIRQSRNATWERVWFIEELPEFRFPSYLELRDFFNELLNYYEE